MIVQEISFVTILILGLASFRLTRLIVYDKITEFLRSPFFNEVEETNEDGTKDIYLLPKEKGLKKWIGELLSCFWCTGIWVSIGITLLFLSGARWGSFIILILAVAAIGSIIEVIISKWIGN